MGKIPWFKVDDGLPTSRKLMSIPRRMRLPALGLWTIAGAWSARELTDGHVPAYMLEEWCATPAQAECLVNAGLWRAERNGYVFHDWHDYQPERSKVLEDREKAKIRMNRVREARRSGEQGANVQANSERTSREVRSTPTRPDPTRPNTSSDEEVGRGKRAARIPEPFLVSQKMRDWARDEVPGVDVDRATRMFVDHWRAASGQNASKKDWVAAWRNWLRKDYGNLSPQQRQVSRPPKSNEIGEHVHVFKGGWCIHCPTKEET